MTQKSFTEILANIAELFATGNQIPPTDFQAIWVNFVNAVLFTKPFPEITEFSGTNGINTIPTTDIAANTKITVCINGHFFNYILMAGDLTTAGSYIIRPDDYAKPGNEKYWKLANALMTAITVDDLDESHKITITHNAGYKYVQVDVFDHSTGSALARVNTSEPTVKEYAYIAADSDYCEILFSPDIDSTYYIIVRI
jgi:hypothetical protein